MEAMEKFKEAETHYKLARATHSSNSLPHLASCVTFCFSKCFLVAVFFLYVQKVLFV